MQWNFRFISASVRQLRIDGHVQCRTLATASLGTLSAVSLHVYAALESACSVRTGLRACVNIRTLVNYEMLIS